LRELAKIIAYLVAVVLLGALLAPLLYWAGNALADGGTFRFLGDVSFQRYFNRAVLVAALVLLWPTVRSLRLGGWRDLGLEPDERWRAHLSTGLVIGAGLVALMALFYVPLGFYRWKGDLPSWRQLPLLALSAVVVALLEECLFRGGILGLFRRTLRPFTALFWVTAIFAIVHFLKPDEEFMIQDVRWLSGFALLPRVFHQFTEPMSVLASFTTIFVLGWVLGYATLRTRSLWLAIGFHAGVVFVKMSFAKFTKREALSLPWVGPELQIGLVPVGVLALGGVLIWFWLRHENSTTRG
jgi:membrane protease YdiL (CAAX protease family)